MMQTAPCPPSLPSGELCLSWAERLHLPQEGHPSKVYLDFETEERKEDLCWCQDKRDWEPGFPWSHPAAGVEEAAVQAVGFLSLWFHGLNHRKTSACKPHIRPEARVVGPCRELLNRSQC